MRVYLDNSATTPLRPEVFEAMRPFFAEEFGNPASPHGFGRTARTELRKARDTVAGLLGAKPEEIIFTSGGTESDNLALSGLAAANRGRGRHIITTLVEHPAVINTCRHLAREGFEITLLRVDGAGRVDPAAVSAAIRPDTIFVSIMLANNETGAIQPVGEIASITRARGIPLHTDAVQAAGKIPLDAAAPGADLISLSGHKFGGPKGTGALFLRRGVRIGRIMHGGHQEGERRAGTENVPGIVGFARAMRLAFSEVDSFRARVGSLRDRLESGIRATLRRVRVNGDPENRLPNILNAAFPGVEGDTLAVVLDTKGVAVSTGSACESGVSEPSRVLTAMGVPPEVARASVRFSLGRTTTEEEIDYAIGCVSEAVSRLRGRADPADLK